MKANLIAEKLTKLFNVQGKYADNEIICDFAEEISQWKFSDEEIDKGIKSLWLEKLKGISLYEIRKAIKENVIPIVEKTLKCEYCNGSGLVSLECDDGYSYAFACKCSAGEKSNYHKNSLRWYGQKKITIGGKTYEYPFEIKEQENKKKEDYYE